MIRATCFASIALCLTVSARADVPARHGEAEAQYRRALVLLEQNSIDSRRMAMRALEQATLLEPTNATYQLTLARTYYRVGFLKSARHRFERVVRMAPNDAEGRFGLGQVWRRDWLKYLDRTSLQRAVDHYSMAARLEPSRCDAWLAMVPLLVETNDLRSAEAAARRGLEADARRPEALLAVAYTAFRMGQVERADSAFRAAYPRLPKNVRDRLEDISPLATEKDTLILNHLPVVQRGEFLRRFWKNVDPDLATPENEAQLEYWARVAHAYFLFYDAKRREWDERGEVYVRYGPPDRTDYNPINMSLYGWGGPRNVLVWYYPALGMRVVMEDRLLSEYYLLPITLDHDPDPVANADSLAKLGSALASGGGRAVFNKLPPGVEPLPVAGAIARFDAAGRTRLLVQVEAPGSPADSLWANWVVLDSTRREISRASRALAPSDCDATELRVADFATELPPGSYQIGLSVRDAQGRRGLYRTVANLETPARDLALSDIVVSCGSPSLSLESGPNPTVRIAPNPGARVDGVSPLTAYFEIYHLMTGRDGQARFEYVYTVKSAERDPRIWLQRVLNPRKQPNPIEVSREEENIGDMRRQFVTVPVQSLPPGRYQLEIKVRDLMAGQEVARTALFVKVASGG
jgi:GWxTD domain-containing protein